MSSFLSGGGRAYGFDIEIIKSPSTNSSITSHSSSPSSILSESSNSPIAISTRKPRTPRKRPNQTYNEAAALLSTANPKIFSAKHLTNNPCKFTKFHNNPFLDDSLIDNSGFLLHQPIREKPNSRIELKVVNSSSGKNPVENEFWGKWNSLNVGDGYQEDFDTESLLDEDIEEGIDSIMGNLSVNNESFDEGNHNTCYGYPMGLGFSGSFDFGFGMRRGVRALRQVDEEDWWRFPTVDVAGKFKKESTQKKKKKKVEKQVELKKSSESDSPPRRNSIPEETKAGSIPESGSGLLLKLNYDKVLNAWSDRGSPFPDEISGSGSGSESCGNDIHARLAQIDLFSEGGGLREASVMRYKEKRRTRLFSKKIRYQVRKVNADRRPRMKGRFVRRPNSPMSGH